MDYLEHVEPERFHDFSDLMAAYPDWTVSFYSSKASQLYTCTPFQDRHFLIFGSETQGLPVRVLEKYADQCYRIPMLPDRRSLNLSSSVAVVLYEGFRQLEGW